MDWMVTMDENLFWGRQDNNIGKVI